jgi:hypothetical protein
VILGAALLLSEGALVKLDLEGVGAALRDRRKAARYVAGRWIGSGLRRRLLSPLRSERQFRLEGIHDRH